MTDLKVEGLLGAAMTLVTAGIELVTKEQDLSSRIIGVVIVGMGFVLILYRGKQKEAGRVR